jgi:hypothetical protein
MMRWWSKMLMRWRHVRAGYRWVRSRTGFEAVARAESPGHLARLCVDRACLEDGAPVPKDLVLAEVPWDMRVLLRVIFWLLRRCRRYATVRAGGA